MAAAKLLLVEDDISLRETLFEMLVDRGFEVTGAENGSQAIIELEGDRGIFNAIITDIKLEGGTAAGRGCPLNELAKSYNMGRATISRILT